MTPKIISSVQLFFKTSPPNPHPLHQRCYFFSVFREHEKNNYKQGQFRNFKESKHSHVRHFQRALPGQKLQLLTKKYLHTVWSKWCLPLSVCGCSGTSCFYSVWFILIQCFKFSLKVRKKNRKKKEKEALRCPQRKGWRCKIPPDVHVFLGVPKDKYLSPGLIFHFQLIVLVFSESQSFLVSSIYKKDQVFCYRGLM